MNVVDIFPRSDRWLEVAVAAENDATVAAHGGLLMASYSHSPLVGGSMESLRDEAPLEVCRLPAAGVVARVTSAIGPLTSPALQPSRTISAGRRQAQGPYAAALLLLCNLYGNNTLIFAT